MLVVVRSMGNYRFARAEVGLVNVLKPSKYYSPKRTARIVLSYILCPIT
jgi:hypothetical protein